jgi:hypothetical protein
MIEVKMVSSLTRSVCVYEVALDGEIVWRRRVPVLPRNMRARVESARAQEIVAGRLLRADDPREELRRIGLGDPQSVRL